MRQAEEEKQAAEEASKEAAEEKAARIVAEQQVLTAEKSLADMEKILLEFKKRERAIAGKIRITTFGFSGILGHSFFYFHSKN